MLKPYPLFVACLATGSFLAAQGGSSLNPVRANNEPYFMVSGSTHATTLNDYNDAFNNPSEFTQAGPGIADNTWVWRLYPGETNDMREPRVVTGMESLFLLSAATPLNSEAMIYSPAYALIGAKQRGGGAGAGVLDPDFDAVYILTPEIDAGAPTIVSDQLIGVGITFNTPVPLDIVGDHAIAAGYHGGEQRDKPADSTTFSQSIVGSVDDGPVYDDANSPYQPDGFAVWDPNVVPPAPATVTYKQYDDSRAILTYFTDNPTVNVYTDWGKRRKDNGSLTPPIRGLSDGSYYADLGSSQGRWGWEVWADPNLYRGGFVWTFANLGRYHGQGTVIHSPLLQGSITTELSDVDPVLLALLGVVMPIDPVTGIADSGEIAIATTVPEMIGDYIGIECLIFPAPDAPSQTVTSTQARFFRIVK